MKCPFCGYYDTRVIDSRPAAEGSDIRRRRHCIKCEARFTTYETRELANFLVEKKSGRREPYSREKLELGIRKALEKRPATEADIRGLLGKIEEEITKNNPKVLASSVIGQAVMRNLRALDEVAYIRFASVYKDFQTAKGFENEIRKLQKR